MLRGLKKEKREEDMGVRKTELGLKTKKTLKVESASGRKLSMLKLCVILTVKEFI